MTASTQQESHHQRGDDEAGDAGPRRNGGRPGRGAGTGECGGHGELPFWWLLPAGCAEPQPYRPHRLGKLIAGPASRIASSGPPHLEHTVPGEAVREARSGRRCRTVEPDLARHYTCSAIVPTTSPFRRRWMRTGGSRTGARDRKRIPSTFQHIAQWGLAARPRLCRRIVRRNENGGRENMFGVTIVGQGRPV